MLMSKDKYLPRYWHYWNGYKKLFRETSLFLAASKELKELITTMGCPREKVEEYDMRSRVAVLEDIYDDVIRRYIKVYG